jgi:hypothetical protein
MQRGIVWAVLGLWLHTGCEPSKEHLPSGPVKDGIARTYYKDGKKRAEVPMVNGKKHGLAREYYPDGTPYQEITYRDGTKHGIARRYFETGILYQETPYDSGRIHGIQKKYRANGKITAEIPWHYGQECVGLVEYTLDGEVKKQYPSIVITPVDQLASKGVYSLQLGVSDNSRGVEFYTGELSDGRYIGPLADRVWGGEDGSGRVHIKYTVLPGSSLRQTVNVIAKIKTVQGNHFIAQRSFRISVAN